MRTITFVFLLAFGSLWAQSDAEKAVEKQIADFFVDFQNRDTAKVRAYFKPGAVLQTIGRDKEGKSRHRVDDFEKFIGSLVKIPDSIQFVEKILAYHIEIDDNMANAWTPYEFYINGKFRHCGANNFQFYQNQAGEWKIISMVDTRRRKGCKSLAP
jgi:hypothetical protein